MHAKHHWGFFYVYDPALSTVILINSEFKNRAGKSNSQFSGSKPFLS